MRASIIKAWFGETDLSDKQQARLALWLTGLDQSLAYHEGVCLDSITLKRDSAGWQLRIQGRRYAKGGGTDHVVVWQEGASFYDCLDLFAQAIKRKEVRWREDKYPIFDRLLND